MAVVLNHTIIRATDRDASAQFFADIFGLPILPHNGGRFTQVRINDDLTIDFDQTDPVVMSQHYAFKVGETDFDGIFERVQSRGVVYGSGPSENTNMQINSRRGGRAIYYLDIDGHLIEVMTA